MASRRAKIGFGYHLTAYAAINAILLWINYDTAGRITWAIWPALGWGIGLIIHAVSVVVSSTKANRGLVYHLVVFISVNALLIVINLTVTPGYLWFKFPLIGWGCMLVFHGWRVLSKDGHAVK